MRQGVPHNQENMFCCFTATAQSTQKCSPAARMGRAMPWGRAAEEVAAVTHHSCDARPQLSQQDRVDGPVRCGGLRVTQARLSHGLHLVIQLQTLQRGFSQCWASPLCHTTVAQPTKEAHAAASVLSISFGLQHAAHNALQLLQRATGEPCSHTHHNIVWPGERRE